jgi:FixJ family two-component response regulator
MHARQVCHSVALDATTSATVAARAEALNLSLITHGSFESFAAADATDGIGCIVVPLEGRGEQARSLLDRLTWRGSNLGVVLLAFGAELRAVVGALRGGASDLLEWPLEAGRLETAMEAACQASTAKQQQRAAALAAQDRLTQLSSGEREVLDLMLVGKVNKSIAARLGIALRTVENRRKQIFTKLGTRGFADIVRIVQDAEGAVPADRPIAGTIPAPLGLTLPPRPELHRRFV